MSVCGDCDKTHLKLREDIHRWRAEIQEKYKLLESLTSVAFAQSKQIFYLKASALTNPAALSPSWLSQAPISDSLPLSRGCSQTTLVPVSLIDPLAVERRQSHGSGPEGMVLHDTAKTKDLETALPQTAGLGPARRRMAQSRYQT